MALRSITYLGLKSIQEFSKGLLHPAIQSATNLQLVRYRRAKHWNPKFKKLRAQKVIKVELPNFNEKIGDLSEEELRSKMKEKGLQPPRPWQERPIYIGATGGVFEPYVPPEGDGKISAITAQGAKQKLQFLEKKTKTMMSIRKIRSFDDEFDTPEFCKSAEEIYIKAHECMANKDKELIQNYITEHAYPKMLHNIQNKTIHWKYLNTIELPRVVHSRCTEVISKENIFAQITVRLHSQQQLAIYDRFGRLMHGSEIIAKDVLEYVVFEKHIANEYGVWRIHDKIIPNWMPPREPMVKTFVKPAPPKALPEPTKAVDDQGKEQKLQQIEDDKKDTVQPAVA